MITLHEDHTGYSIHCAGGAEDWLRTVKSLLTVLGNQDDNSVLKNGEITDVCNLIIDMLPDDEQVQYIECKLRELKKDRKNRG